MRQSHTAVLARNEPWAGKVATEPFEVAWASEAIFFVRALEPADLPGGIRLSVQISPDGMHWCDHGATLPLTGDPEVPGFATVSGFGGWLRLAGELPHGHRVKVVAYLALKE